MDQHFVEKLDAAREYLSLPFVITSGYRCAAHNDAVSDSGTTGPHTTGKAADIALSYQDARKALPTLSLRFGGIGLQQKGPRDSRFIHVDDLAPRIWTY
jgi:uncharacterized protein YcbK (DUF882 family)